MHLHASLIRFWAYSSMTLVAGIILLLFEYVFYRGAGIISREFLSQSPRGAVLGEGGGIWPTIVGSLCFMATTTVLGGIPTITAVLFMVFYCKRRRTEGLIRMVIQHISGLPSIVLGLFAYSFLVRDLAWGCCILPSRMALAVMILPFIEIKTEKASRELLEQLIQPFYALDCTRFYTIWKIALSACRGETVSGVILESCYAMGVTAPLTLTGAVAYSSLPARLTAPTMALSIYFYLLAAQGATSTGAAYGIVFIVMAPILIGSLLATTYARRSRRKWNIS